MLISKIKYIGNSRVRVDGKLLIKPGDVVKYGDIPDDSFEYLSGRGDFTIVDDDEGEV